MQTLDQLYLPSWTHTRQMTYDYLDMLTTEQLSLTLPFPESQPLGYQFWCMIGAHESYLRKLEHGSWQGFACSLDSLDPVTIDTIKNQMRQSDDNMAALLPKFALDAMLADGNPAQWTVLQMLKHENLHHGQLINYIYCHQLPIPKSWADEWALSRE